MQIFKEYIEVDEERLQKHKDFHNFATGARTIICMIKDCPLKPVVSGNFNTILQTVKEMSKKEFEMMKEKHFMGWMNSSQRTRIENTRKR